LTGLPIPIKVKGPWEDISYKADWNKVFDNISADPERLKNLPQNLRDAGKSFGVDLPVPNLPDVLKSPDRGTGASPLDVLRQLKKQPSEAPTGSAPTKGSEEKEQPPVPDLSKVLKDLFKR
jgi:hypothetical protein